MAVVQISRIQVRRGQKQVTGMPQLASGEIAWAVDTQELYIGNGSVAEGSPGVGNTKILTQNDLTIQGNLLNLLQHIYKANDTTIITGDSSNNPTSRSVQDRLDDHVSLLDFVTDEELQLNDYTVPLQRAIDQLFFNDASPAYADNYLSTNPADWNDQAVTARRILELPAGKFTISGTIYVPSYATIVGAGSDKTILQFTNDSSAIKFINDAYPLTTTLTPNTQARFITLKGLTVFTDTSDQIALDMYSVCDSRFDDIIIRGSWTVDTPNSIGIKMSALSVLTTCARNMFTNITVHGFAYGVYAKADIVNNTFLVGHMYDVNQGFGLGNGMIGGSGQPVGLQFGPCKTTIDGFNFEEVKQQAVYVACGIDNIVKNCRLTNVGQDAGSVLDTQYPQIYFKVNGNVAENNSSDRWALLHNSTNIGVQYVPEVSGWGAEQSFGTKRIDLGAVGLAFRLPVSTDSGGVPGGSIVYIVDYVYQSRNNGFTRRGTLTISANIDLVRVQLSDEYDYAGPVDPSGQTALQLDFTVGFLNSSGNATTTNPYSIAINYVNSLVGDSGYLTFSYKAIHSYLP